MPTNDQNATPGGATPNTNPTPKVPSQDISDLGDILMDKTMDATQKSDFVGVQKSDVDMLSSSTDTSIPMESSATGSNAGVIIDALNSEAPISPAAPQTPVESELDLGDISLEDLSQPVEPVSTNPELKIDIDAIQSMSIPEGSSTTINESANISEPTNDSPVSIDAAISEGNDNTLDTPAPEVINTPDNATNINDMMDAVKPTVSASDSISDSIPANPEVTSNEIQDIPQDVQTMVAESNTLGDISINQDITPQIAEVTEKVAPNTESILETNKQELINMDSLNDMGLESSIGVQENSSPITSLEATVTPAEATSESILEPIVQGASETPVEQSIDEMVSATAQPIQEPTPEESAMISQPAQETSLQEIPMEEQAFTTSQIPDTSIPPVNEVVNQESQVEIQNTPEIQQIQEPIVNEKDPSLINIDQKMAEVQAATDEIQGLDLDSLVAAQNTPDTSNINQPAPIPTLEAPKSNKKQMGMVLAILGIIALAGLGYFGYKTMYPVGVDGPSSDTDIIQDTGSDIGSISTGDMFGDTGNESATGDIASTGDEFGGGIITNPEDTFMTGSENTGDTMMQGMTYDQAMEATTNLATIAKRLLIKATINKNGSARITAFSIQKDIEDFKQALEKTTDISTLGDVNGKIEGFNQRLDSLEARLNGTNNQ